MRDFNSSNRNAAWVSKWDQYQNYWVLINAFCIRIFEIEICQLQIWDLTTSWRHVLKTPWRHALKTSSIRLQHNNFCLPRRFHDVFKTSWKTKNRFEDMSWRRLQGVFKTNKCLLGISDDSIKPINDIHFCKEYGMEYSVRSLQN